METFEVQRELRGIGRRTMLRTGRRMFHEQNGQATILVASRSHNSSTPT
jgi:hypothetical protein